jgi:hypothetical protein
LSGTWDSTVEALIVVTVVITSSPSLLVFVSIPVLSPIFAVVLCVTTLLEVTVDAVWFVVVLNVVMSTVVVMVEVVMVPFGV